MTFFVSNEFYPDKTAHKCESIFMNVETPKGAGICHSWIRDIELSTDNEGRPFIRVELKSHYNCEYQYLHIYTEDDIEQ
jgi:hypothetical protein